MLKNFKNNHFWVETGIETFGCGIVLFLGFLTIYVRVPPPFNEIDNPMLGIIMIVLGVILVVNFLWDFYFYYIRLALIVMTEVVWALLSASIIMSDLLSPTTEFVSFSGILTFVLTIRIIINAWLEPPHKLLGKGGTKNDTI